RKICWLLESMRTLQPREQPGQIDLDSRRNHTRLWNRKSLDSSAPTGQTSTTLPEYGLSRRLPGNSVICAWKPRFSTFSSPVLVTSEVKRTQRVHSTQRSWSSSTCGPSSSAFCRFILRNAKRLSYRPCFM